METLLLSTENVTLVIVLMFVLLVLALILLPAASFIRLVGLIRENGSKVEAVKQEVRQAVTTLSNGQANGYSSNQSQDTRTMQELADTHLTEHTSTSKYQKNS